jgi:lipoprotein-releasing system ATP-binding protein
VTDESAITPLLEAKGLSKAYHKGDKRIAVLQNITVRIHAGEMVSVVGKSGAGKSTLLHLLGTLDIPDSGTIAYKGQTLNGMSSSGLADFRNGELGFVFQFHHLLPEFSALENVMLPALIRRQSRKDAVKLAQAALDDVGLSQRLQHKPGELSGGEQQRVALARALVLQPKLLLADEVTGNLDARTGEEIHQLLFGLNQERHITMVVVTHNLALADRMSRRMLLENGEIKERT